MRHDVNKNETLSAVKKMQRLLKWRKKNCSNGKENGFFFGSSFPEKKNAPKYGTFDTLVKSDSGDFCSHNLRPLFLQLRWQQCDVADENFIPYYLKLPIITLRCVHLNSQLTTL
ncbi:hypothetical protein CEXT_529771 [Caerostris extrusa]|uniref:Uncharacterized protein n=1 Tax=Caerostris extrusa TaxID=172846 RepID=A0AAV4TDZ9_CAEEX|nr:hypothetical protein CEXT_529771 [Caerostris extrusa]